MPDFFYHIRIELCVDTTLDSHSSQPPSLASFFDALRPFKNTSRRPERKGPSAVKRKHLQDKGLKDLDACSDSPIEEPLPSLPDDHRFDHIRIGGADMADESSSQKEPSDNDNIVGKGIGQPISGQYMKGAYRPLAEQGWGIVHLYRDASETPGLYKPSPLRSSDLWSDNSQVSHGKPHPPPRDEDCTSLCILAVPSYMTPPDFLAFVGEETRMEVTHFRMVRTERPNRYMVLMKFKRGKTARVWQHEWNGKVFNPMEPETCHVVFLKSVELFQPPAVPANSTSSTNNGSTFPRVSNDPFVPSTTATTPTAKPFAPRTPSLVELPTCPVCLERMDETSGLLTIPCQHVFHCTCLQKWSGGGCPVCRYKHDDFSSGGGAYKRKSKTPGEYDVGDQPLDCETCHVSKELWQCLICGKVGCGRYQGKHAHAHHEESAHAYSMDLESKRVWGYVEDRYVHRIMQDAAQPGEKLVEIPGRSDEPTALEGQKDVDRANLENIALEYTHLLTSQLDSQRVYFEQILERAADKATIAGQKAAEAIKNAERYAAEVKQKDDELQTFKQHDFVEKGRLQELEKDKTRAEGRASKLEQIAKDTNRKYLDEQEQSVSLNNRIKYIEATVIDELRKRIKSLEEENLNKNEIIEILQEQNRDAKFQVSAAQQLQDMVRRGEIDQEELDGAEVTVGRRPLTARERIKERIEAARSSRSAKTKFLPEAPSSTGSAPDAARAVRAAEPLPLRKLAQVSDGHFDAARSYELGDLVTAFGPSTGPSLRVSNETRFRAFVENMHSKLVEDGVLEMAEPVESGNPMEVAAGEETNQSPGKRKKKSKGKTDK